MIQQDGVTPLPKEVWNLVHQSRTIVLETIATLSPRDWNFVFTHGFEGTSGDYEMANDIFEVAGRRSADILVVRLTCSADELKKRVVTAERRNRFKEVDPEPAHRNASLPVFDAGSHRAITIETSGLSAEGTAERILLELHGPIVMASPKK